MHLRTLFRNTRSGRHRYVQLVQSFRKPDGTPATHVLAHLGLLDDLALDNLRAALAANRTRSRLRVDDPVALREVTVRIDTNLTYLPFDVIATVMRRFGLTDLLHTLCPAPAKAAAVATVVEALVAHRCLDADSKLALQTWMTTAAVEEVLGVPPKRLNNTRVHRVLDVLARVDERLQDATARRVLDRGVPRVLYLDLTDTWFVAGGGSLARRNETKQGHRCKLKIHIALMVDAEGLPLRWRLLPGALSETTVLPAWVEALRGWPELKHSVLVFDRGMPSVDNLRRLTDAQTGHLFLTSIKSDSIATYVTVDADALAGLQALPADPTAPEVEAACARLGLENIHRCTWACDLGVRAPPEPKTHRAPSPPPVRLYLYFNPEMQATRRERRAKRVRAVETYVETLNAELRAARQPRQEQATLRKVHRVLERQALTEIYTVTLDPLVVKGRRKAIASWQVRLSVRKQMLDLMRRYDGLTLLVAHPEVTFDVRAAVEAYRSKAAIEADFRTIKSELDLRPTYHRVDHKIQEHVTLCVLALLVERLIERDLSRSSLREPPLSAHALFAELSRVALTRLTVGGRPICLRTKEDSRIRKLLSALDLESLLEKYPSQMEVPIDP